VNFGDNFSAVSPDVDTRSVGKFMNVDVQFVFGILQIMLIAGDCFPQD